jgi:tight adherence protein C
VAAAVGGLIGKEFDRAALDTVLGETTTESLKRLRGRNPAPGLGSAVTALVDTLEMGAELAPALLGVASDVRQEHREAAIAAAARTGPRISLVVAATFLPAALALIGGMLLLGPAEQLLSVFQR